MLTQVSPDTEACWALLERIAASKQLRRAARLQELLFYVSKRSLKEGCDRIHEQEIGCGVFRRPDSYDTGVDNIVRTNVSDLRKRIEAYFNSEGSHETLIVEIPRGSYVPVFRYRLVEAEPAEQIPNEAVQTGSNEPQRIGTQRIGTDAMPRVHANRSWMPAALVIAGVLIVLLAGGCIYFWSQYRALHEPLSGWQSKPAVTAFWSQFLGANPTTDIVISDTGIGLAQALSRKTFPLNDYLSRGYISQLQSAEMSPDMHAAINRILAWNLVNPGEFGLARRILALDPLGKSIHLYNARNYLPDLINRDNIILIGARESNPWDELFDGRMNFITEFDSPRVVNRAPAAGELPVYPQSDSEGYCVVAYMPSSDRNRQVLLIEGTDAEATEAAGDFLLSEDQLSNFRKMLHRNDFPYFQVLLKVSSVRGTPLSAAVQAYRAYPNLH